MAYRPRSVVKLGGQTVRVRHVKPSNCFRRVEKLIKNTFHFWHVFHPSWCETCRVIQQQFWMKECDIWEWVETYSDPPRPTYFQGGQDPGPPWSAFLLRSNGIVYRAACGSDRPEWMKWGAVWSSAVVLWCFSARTLSSSQLLLPDDTGIDPLRYI